MSKEVANKLKDIQVFRMEDQTWHRLGDFWEKGPVLLCMFRRWGCGICKMSAVNFSAMHPFLEAKGVQLIGLGVEKLGYEEWTEQGYFTGQLFVDDGKKAYQALSLKTNTWRNLWGLLDGDIMRLFRLSQSKGFANNLKGDTAQLGGTFLFDKGGVTLYEHQQTPHSFEPDMMKILEALKIDVPTEYDPYPAYAQRPGCKANVCKMPAKQQEQ